MSIVIDENLIGIWYTMTGKMDDFMLAVRKCPEGLELVYRHRYYHSADPWDEQDKKNWYRMVTDGRDEQKAIATARQMLFGIANVSFIIESLDAPPKVYELLMGDKTVEQFFEAFKTLPFVHAREETKQ